jgi:hypothetical protein
MSLAIKELFGIKKSKKSEEEKQKESIPISHIGNIFQTTDKKYKILAKVTPVNAELSSDDDLEMIFNALYGALSTFDGRIGIYILSERIDIENNIFNIEKKQQELDYELKIDWLEEEKNYLLTKKRNSSNVLNFYLVLESNATKYQVAEQLLEDALRSFNSELKGGEMDLIQYGEEETKRLFYELLNPESSMYEPYQDGWGLYDISPKQIKRFKDGKHIENDDRLYRTFAISRYPETVDNYRWLKKIFKVNGEVRIAITLNPKDKSKISKELSKAATEAGAKSKETKDEAEKRKFAKEKESALALIDEIGSDNTTLYDTNITISISEKDKDKLDTLARSLKAKISSCFCQSSELKYKGLDAFWTTLPFLVTNKITQNYIWNMSSADIASLIPFDSSELMEEQGVRIGENPDSKGTIIVDPYNKKMYNNPHMAILADSGSGKTFFVMCDAIRHLPYRDYIIMFDIEGEFWFPWGRRFTFSPTENTITNPFHIRNAVIDSDGLDDGESNVGTYLASKIMDTVVFFKWIYPEMTSFDAALLEEDIRDCYSDEEVGLTFESKALPKKFPTLNTLDKIMKIKIADKDNYSEKEREHRINMLTSFGPYIKGAYASMFNGQTNWDFDEFTVFDISQVSEAVRKPLYDILLKDTWQFCKTDRTKSKRVYVDEAHEFADKKKPETLMFISTSVKRGRKYGVSFVTATQNLPDFLSIERYGQAIIDNSFFKIFFRLGETDIPVAQKLYSFSDKEMKILKGARNKKATQGKGIFIAGSQRVQLQTIANKHELEIVSPEQFKEIYNEEPRYQTKQMHKKKNKKLAEEEVEGA